MKKVILFVDDEPSVLQGLKRILRTYKATWELLFATSGQQALDILHQQHVDAVISDMRMPGMNGAELLEQISEQYPRIMRIILSGHSDDELVKRVSAVAHQYLAKPTKALDLYLKLQRAFSLKSFLELSELENLVTGLNHLPSVPSLYKKILEKIQQEDTTIADISAIISEDPAMSVKILQLVNSAFFGVGRHITSINDAVSMIGLDAIKSMVLSSGIFAQFDGQAAQQKGFSVDKMQAHSLATASLAREIAAAIATPQQMQDDCFLAGLVHDLGLLVLVENKLDEYQEVYELLKEDMDLYDAEKEVFNTTHAAIGGYIFALWGLPTEVVEAVAFHHRPMFSKAEEFCPLVAVHVANELLHPTESGLDMDLLQRTGCTDYLEQWKALLKH